MRRVVIIKQWSRERRRGGKMKHGSRSQQMFVWVLVYAIAFMTGILIYLHTWP